MVKLKKTDSKNVNVLEQLELYIGLPSSSVRKKSASNVGDPGLIQEFDPVLVRKIRWRRNRLPTPIFLSFPCGSAGKECDCNAGDLGSIRGLGRSPGEGKGYPLQYYG